jgi:hypothetical protein
MKNITTIYHFIIDQSGSMAGMENETIQGFNDQLETLQSIQQKYPEQKLLCSLTFFNAEIIDRITLGSVEDLKMLLPEDYKPMGSTALLDAVGKSIFNIQCSYANELENGGISVVMVIITDGHENASRLYTSHEIGQKIEVLKESGLWTFTFIGADFDAIETASKLKFDRRDVLNIQKSEMADFASSLKERIKNYAESKEDGEIKTNLF